jgi:hypothetical protein
MAPAEVQTKHSVDMKATSELDVLLPADAQASGGLLFGAAPDAADVVTIRQNVGCSVPSMFGGRVLYRRPVGVVKVSSPPSPCSQSQPGRCFRR